MLDPANGLELKRVSLTTNVRITSGYPNYESLDGQRFQPAKKAITYQTNIVVGNYHYFLSHKAGFIGRIHLKTDAVEYLEVPLQIVRSIHNKEIKILHQKTLPNDMKNVMAFSPLKTNEMRVVAGDMYQPRAQRSSDNTCIFLRWSVLFMSLSGTAKS